MPFARQHMLSRSYAAPQASSASVATVQPHDALLNAMTAYLQTQTTSDALAVDVDAQGALLVASENGIKEGEVIFRMPSTEWIVGDDSGAATPMWVATAQAFQKQAVDAEHPWLTARAKLLQGVLAWPEEEANALLQNTQLLSTLQGYRAHVDSVAAQNEQLGPVDELWKLFGLVRMLARPPCADPSEPPAIVPLLDTVRHVPQPLANAVVKREAKSDGVLGMGASEASVVCTASRDIAPGEVITVDLGTETPLTTSRCALDFGHFPMTAASDGYELALGIPPNDVNRDDKLDILETNGYPNAERIAPVFVLTPGGTNIGTGAGVDAAGRADDGRSLAAAATRRYIASAGWIAAAVTSSTASDPSDSAPRVPGFILNPVPDAMWPVIRLVQMNATDCFLLEALFRNEVWGHINLPVSEMNERNACTSMSGGARAAFDALGGDDAITSADEEIATIGTQALELGAELPISDLRRLTASFARRSEALSLRACVVYFDTYAETLGDVEYYQERRLRGLNLIDDDGKPMTFDEMLSEGWKE